MRTAEHFELRIDHLKKKDPVANEQLIRKAKRQLAKVKAKEK